MVRLHCDFSKSNNTQGLFVKFCVESIFGGVFCSKEEARPDMEAVGMPAQGSFPEGALDLGLRDGAAQVPVQAQQSVVPQEILPTAAALWPCTAAATTRLRAFTDCAKYWQP